MSHDGPSEEVRLPENHVPSDAELVSVVLSRRLVTLRELSKEVWPDLPWTAAPGLGSAVGEMRTWPVALGPGTIGNRSMRLTAACYLMDRMQDLVIRGAVRCGPVRRDLMQECPAGGLTYVSAVADGQAVRLTGDAELRHA